MHKRARSSKRSNEQTHPIHYQNKNIATDNGKHSHIKTKKKTKERNTKAPQKKKRQQQPRNKNKNCRKKLMRNEISSTNERSKKN